MSYAIHSPLDTSDVIDLGMHAFRKELLKVGEIDYNGRKIRFTRDMLADLVQSFKDRAYDVVPFLMGDGKSDHEVGPEAMRGKLAGVELTDDDRLVGTFDLNDAAAERVREFPEIGVSARIIDGLARADGAHFKHAMEHVVATLRPRINGLSPWTAVELASPELTTLDLVEARYSTSSGGPVADSPFTPEELAKLRALLGTPEPAAPVAPPAPRRGSKDVEAFFSDWTPEELEALDADPETAPEVPVVQEPVTASLSAEQRNVLDLAVAQAAQAQADTLQMRTDLAAERWSNTRRELAGQGVPPSMLDLWAPILANPDSVVIDLAGDNKIDLAQIGRDTLTLARGFIPLGVRGAGHTDIPDEDAATTAVTLDSIYSSLPASLLKPRTQGA